MSFVEGFIRFVLGGTLVLIVGILGKTDKKYLAGIIVLFPAITAVGYFFLSQKLSGDELKRIVLTSIFTLPTTLVFLLCLYFTITRMNILYSLIISIAGWSVSAVIYVLIKERIIF